MVEPITAIYVQADDEWTVTVSTLGEKLTAKAPGIIAARDATDQLVEKLAPDGRSTVVHLLNGSALEFTATYMSARLTLPESATAPVEVPPPGTKRDTETAKTKPAKAAAPEKPAAKPPIPVGKPLPKAVEPRKSSSKPRSRSAKDDSNGDVAVGRKPGGAMPAAKA
jgi:hypothetical protein